ncbi:hypothetical protein FGO68_gene4326 [Halteria grandinella]|uniref:UDP-N-acetylglucosamine transferase subunit ALG14 n=1 Tax=Halteria grandinella TaxID=5974 RepID=A0A8J8SYW5_HALGN|nr:hypothetical protein FGO68_gene4326 [Halteria grandinella]
MRTLGTLALYYYIIAVTFAIYYRLRDSGRIPELDEKKLMVVFGSGGHTTEMLLMLTKDNQFNFQKYGQVQFVIGHSDTWSLTKIKDYFSRGGTQIDWEKDVQIIKLFRSREVKQSYLTSILTTIVALLHSAWVVAKLRPDIVVTNGPGTAVPLCYIHFFFSKVLLWNLKAKILFIESFCRVTSLSLSGKLLLPIADKFVVHWNELKLKHPKVIVYKEKII